MFKQLNFYVDFDWEEYVNNKDSYFSSLFNLIEIVYQHGCSVYYCKERLEKFIKDLKNIEDIDSGFITSKANNIDLTL